MDKLALVAFDDSDAYGDGVFSVPPAEEAVLVDPDVSWDQITELLEVHLQAHGVCNEDSLIDIKDWINSVTSICLVKPELLQVLDAGSDAANCDTDSQCCAVERTFRAIIKHQAVRTITRPT